LLKKNKQFSLNQSVFIIFGFALFIGLVLWTSSSTIIKIASVSTQVDSFLPSSLTNRPVRLKIPDINVDATFEYVGLTEEGEMDVPKGPANVAWFKLGTIPGENGSAVVAGHSGYKNNKMGVFDNLYKLRKGDKLYVEDEKGNISIFVVSKIQIYNPQANAGDVFISSDGKAHMNLITCTGLWNEAERTHSNRLVIFTDKVE
jgi:LPXTG-site transpeptidase (sortase) family protein